jgi:predicted MFS family arabinose efflux permease
LLRAALGVTLIANIGSVFASTFVLLCLARLAVGISGGVIQAIVYATTAMRTNKDRTYAVLNIAVLLWGAVSLGALPPLLASFGTAAVFVSFIVLSLLSLALAGHVPRHAKSSSTSAMSMAQPVGRNGALLLILFVLLFAGHGALWVYQERIGKTIGIPPATIGMILGLSVLSGAVGAGLAGMIGRRIGNLSAQVISFGGAIVATLLMVYGSELAAYALTACVLMLVWFFGLTYMLAMAAQMDSTGRLPGLANAAIFVGQGLGPAIGAVAIGAGNFRNVGWAAAVVYLIGLVLAIVVTSRVGRRPLNAGEAERAAQLRSV